MHISKKTSLEWTFLGLSISPMECLLEYSFVVVINDRNLTHIMPFIIVRLHIQNPAYGNAGIGSLELLIGVSCVDTLDARICF